MSIGKIFGAQKKDFAGQDPKIAEVLEKAKEVFDERISCLSIHPRFNDAYILQDARRSKK